MKRMLSATVKREDGVSDEEVMSAALYPKVFNEFARFKKEFGDVTLLPTRLFFRGPMLGEV